MEERSIEIWNDSNAVGCFWRTKKAMFCYLNLCRCMWAYRALRDTTKPGDSKNDKTCMHKVFRIFRGQEPIYGRAKQCQGERGTIPIKLLKNTRVDVFADAEDEGNAEKTRVKKEAVALIHEIIATYKIVRISYLP
jgi:hypothetical protein